jgi:hypothetical protein
MKEREEREREREIERERKFVGEWSRGTAVEWSGRHAGWSFLMGLEEASSVGRHSERLCPSEAVGRRDGRLEMMP